MAIEVKVPDIGDFKDVPIIEIHVQAGSAGQGRGSADHAGERQGHHGRARPAGRHRGRAQGRGRRPGGRGGGDPPARAGGCCRRSRPRTRSRKVRAPGSGEPAGYGSSAGVYETIEVKVPDIGDFKDVPVIEVHVAEGAVVKAEDPLLTLECDKATMDVPSPAAGTVTRPQGQGRRPGRRGYADPARCRPVPPSRRPCCRGAAPAAPLPAPTPKPATGGKGDFHAEVAGAGRRPRRLHRRLPRRRPRPPGGAGRALADPGRRLPQCRLHPVQGAAARRQGDRRDRGDGRTTASSFAAPTVDLDALRGWKDGVVKKLTGGLSGLAKARKVTVVQGIGPVHLARTSSRSSRPTAARRP